MSDLPEDLTEREYHLTCRLRVIKKTVQDQYTNGGRTYERTLCLLIPQDSDQRTKFFTAWLPEVSSEYYELGAYLSHPINSPCRLSIHRRDSQSPEAHYLFVMTKGVEDELLKYMKEGHLIKITTLPASQDTEIDNAVDTDLDIEAKT